MSEKWSVIIPCGGKGTRMGGSENKLFLNICGKPCLYYTLSAFRKLPFVSEILLPTKPGDEARIREICAAANVEAVIVPGGSTREESVKNGVSAAKEDWVMVHDGARCLIDEETILKTTRAALENGAAACGVQVKDTLKKTDENGFIAETVSREHLIRIQTPQAVRRETLLTAYKKAQSDGFS